MSESEQEKSRQETGSDGAELLLGLTKKSASEKRKRESKRKEYESEYNAEYLEHDENEDENNSDSESDENDSGSKHKKSKKQKNENGYEYFGKRLPSGLTTLSIRINNKDNYQAANLVISSKVNGSIYASENDKAATKYFKTIVKKAEDRSKEYNVPFQDLVFNCIRFGVKKGDDQQLSGFNLLIKRNFLGTAHYLLNHVKPTQKEYLLNLLDEMVSHDILGFSIYEDTVLSLKTRLNIPISSDIESDKESSSDSESSPISAINQQTSTTELKENKESSSNKENAVLPLFQTTYNKNGKEKLIKIPTDFVNSLKEILLGKGNEQDQTLAARIKRASDKIDNFFKDRSEAAGIFAYRLGSRLSKNPLDPDRGLTFFAFLIKHNFIEINEKIIEQLEYKEHADQLMRAFKKLKGVKNFHEHYQKLYQKIKDRNLKSNIQLQKNSQEILSSSNMESSHLTTLDPEMPINRNEEKNGGEKRKAETQLYNNLVGDEGINTSASSLSALQIPCIDSELLENKETISFKKSKRATLPYYKKTDLNGNRIAVPREFVEDLKSKILSEKGQISDSLITEFSIKLEDFFKQPEPDSLAVILGKYRNLIDKVSLFTFLIEHDCLKLNEKFIDQLTNQEQANLLMKPVKNIVDNKLDGYQKYEEGYNSLLIKINARCLPSYKTKQPISSASSSRAIIQTLPITSTNSDVEIIDLSLPEKKNEPPSIVESSSLITQNIEVPLNHHNKNTQRKELKTIAEEEITSNTCSDILTIQAASSSSSSIFSNESLDISLLLQLLRESEQAAIILLRKKLFSNNHRLAYHQWVFQLATQPTPNGINFFTHLIEVNSLTMAEMIIERLTEEEIKPLFKSLEDHLEFIDKDKFEAYTNSMNTLKDYAKTLGVTIKTKKKRDNKDLSKKTNEENAKFSVTTTETLSLFRLFAESYPMQPAETKKANVPKKAKQVKNPEIKRTKRKYAKGISKPYVINSDGSKTKVHTDISEVYIALEWENKASNVGFTARAALILSKKLMQIANYPESHFWAFEIAKQRPDARPDMSFLAYLCKLNRLEMAKSVLRLLNPEQAEFILNEINEMISANIENFKEYAPRLEDLKGYYKGLTPPEKTSDKEVLSSETNAALISSSSSSSSSSNLVAQTGNPFTFFHHGTRGLAAMLPIAPTHTPSLRFDNDDQ